MACMNTEGSKETNSRGRLVEKARIKKLKAAPN